LFFSTVPQGYYLAPTVITNVEPHMTIWKEEVFGPVLVVKTFATEDQALALANDSCFGLAASVLSKDEVRAQRMVRGIKAGIAWVNCSQPCFCQVEINSGVYVHMYMYMYMYVHI